ncbi:hypothetical protein LHV13_04840 [Ferrovum sp. PN-J185]|nr:hypothetical protein [Ferrovum sp. PN-J185]MCC6068503.1 hypothetical protein [Ferrovum sp. PN-J185]MDE2057184.1 hypothetical protein [Betaproteobacteria bacterium]
MVFLESFAVGGDPTTNKRKTNPLGLVFFAYYREFAGVPADSCGLRR